MAMKRNRTTKTVTIALIVTPVRIRSQRSASRNELS